MPYRGSPRLVLLGMSMCCDLGSLRPFFLRMPKSMPPQHTTSSAATNTADADAPKYRAAAPAAIASAMQTNNILISKSSFVRRINRQHKVPRMIPSGAAEAGSLDAISWGLELRPTARGQHPICNWRRILPDSRLLVAFLLLPLAALHHPSLSVHAHHVHAHIHVALHRG